jgi:hypothetical protein
MPRFDGTGPLGQGPLTGQGQGFCVLTTSEENPNHIQGFAGIDSRPIGQMKMNEGFKFAGKEVINMPFGNGTGSAGMGPMTGRAAGFCAGYPVPGYMNPVGARGAVHASGMFPVAPYAAGNYGYARFYTPGRWFGRGFGRLGFGRGFGRGRGRGRGRFGYWW